MASYYYNERTYATNVGTAAVLADLQTDLVTNSGMGWTLLDTVTAGSDLVFRSPDFDGIAGNTAGYYSIIRLTVNANGINIKTYMDWDVTAHVGINAGGFAPAANPGCQVYTGGTLLTTGIRVNQYAFVYFSTCNLSGSYTAVPGGLMYGGFTKRPEVASLRGIAKTTTAYAAGVATMSTNVNMLAQWAAGQILYIQNFAHNNASANKQHCEYRTILSVSATSVTFTGNTANAYDSGAVLSPYSALSQAYGSAYNGQVASTGNWSNGGGPIIGANLAGGANGGTISLYGWSNAYTTFGNPYVDLIGVGNSIGGDESLASTGILYHIGMLQCSTAELTAGPTNYTDGVNVWRLLALPAAVSTPGYCTPVVGPTGVTPSLSTMPNTALPYIVPDDTTAYQASLPAPAPGVSPINQFNQGLN